MSSYQRQQVSILRTRLRERPERLILVSGPRQTGKTTLVRQALDQIGIKSQYIAVDESSPSWSVEVPSDDAVVAGNPQVSDQKWLLQVWEEARRQADDEEKGFVLALDEIQKIPGWSDTVKGLWDADRFAGRNMHVIVLGSAPLPMQQGLSESMAGRFEVVPVRHWCFGEMMDAFGFDRQSYVYFGGYPGAADLIRDQPRWRAYLRSSIIEPNIEKDVLSMTRVDKPALLRAAFELGSAYSGQILSYQKMQGQLQDAGNTTTLAHYLDLLSQAGLLAGLPKYSGRQLRQRRSSPKLNVLNTAFMAIHSGYSFEEALADRTFWGRLVESTVGAHLYNSGMPDIRLHYWRESPHEVDFVLAKGQRLIAIEVKSARRGDNASGLERFRERFAPERTLLVGGHGMPLEEFLSQPAAHWFDSS